MKTTKNTDLHDMLQEAIDYNKNLYAATSGSEYPLLVIAIRSCNGRTEFKAMSGKWLPPTTYNFYVQ